MTKKIKEGANVPVYVLEFLLGQYCSSDDEFVIEEGLNTVKRILADNYVRPDEAQKIMSQLRQRGGYTVIDKLTVTLNIKNDKYEAEFMNLGLKNIPIPESYPSEFDRLLCGGIWCIVGLDYEYDEEERNVPPVKIRKLTPIQMENLASTLQVCLDSGAKKVLLPITAAADLSTVPSELIGCFNIIFYQSPEDAVFKALGVE